MTAHDPQRFRTRVPEDLCTRLRALSARLGRMKVQSGLKLSGDYFQEIASGHGVLAPKAIERVRAKLDAFEKANP